MSIVEILYIITGACIVVITVTIVWLANETIKLVKSLRKSSDDVAFMTREVKEKVLVVTEALDRAGTAATNIIGFIEDAIEGIKEKRDQLANSMGLVSGVGEFFKRKKAEASSSTEAARGKEPEAEKVEVAEKEKTPEIKKRKIEKVVEKKAKEPVEVEEEVPEENTEEEAK